jgi:hypothetical protein
VLLEELMGKNGTLDLTAPDGRKFGVLVVEGLGVPPPGFQLPYTEHELAERRKDRGPGRKLDDILAELKAKYGE